MEYIEDNIDYFLSYFACASGNKMAFGWNGL